VDAKTNKRMRKVKVPKKDSETEMIRSERMTGAVAIMIGRTQFRPDVEI
jgi:hypothetical protein